MRAMLVAAFLTAGCLHAQAPATGAAKADPEALYAFEVLLNDDTRLAEAAAFAKERRLPRADVAALAERAYWRYLRGGGPLPAAEIAWRFRFPERAVLLALADARRAFDAADADYRRLLPYAPTGTLRSSVVARMTTEIRIACRHAGPKEAAKTVERALLLEAVASADAVYPLLDEDCPVEAETRTRIIHAARQEGRMGRQERDAFAIRHAARARWDVVQTSQFIGDFFARGDCTDGLKAVVALRLSVERAEPFFAAARCEGETIRAGEWVVAKEAADRWFFAAVRGGQDNLALALLPHGTHGDDGRAYLFQEVVRAHRETGFLVTAGKHPGAHDAFMAYLWERARYRFIANFAASYEWQRRAFDKLLELGKWEDAAEAAQYGWSMTLRREGILLAFKAAMAAGDFKAGRYFVARYGPAKDDPGLVTQEMYEAEREKRYAAKRIGPDPDWMRDDAPKAKPKTRKKPKAKRRTTACPDDDWCP